MPRRSSTPITQVRTQADFWNPTGLHERHETCSRKTESVLRSSYFPKSCQNFLVERLRHWKNHIAAGKVEGFLLRQKENARGSRLLEMSGWL
jgi:hypothetical protein